MNTSVLHKEKVIIGLKNVLPIYEVRKRVLGPNDTNLKYISKETGAVVTLQGQGSGYLEDDTGLESPEPLHIHIEHHNISMMASARLLALNLIENIQLELTESTMTKSVQMPNLKNNRGKDELANQPVASSSRVMLSAICNDNLQRPSNISFSLPRSMETSKTVSDPDARMCQERSTLPSRSMKSILEQLPTQTPNALLDKCEQEMVFTKHLSIQRNPAQLEQDRLHKMSTLRSQEVLIHSQDKTFNKDETKSVTSVSTDQLSSPRIKRPNLSTAQRREALRLKLLERGETFDPAKWRRGKKKPKRPETAGASGLNLDPKAESEMAKRPRGDMATSPCMKGPTKKARSERFEEKQTALDPGTERVSYRDTSAIKMAIILEAYPDAKLTAEQGEAIEDAIMDELQPLEDGSAPSFTGTFLESGALITSCLNNSTKRWLEELIPRLDPLGEQNKLKVVLRKNLLMKSTRVFFRAHPKLLKKTPEEVLKMLDTQNPSLRVRDWKVLSTKPDPKGYGFVCFLGEACFKAVRSANYKANLGLWQVSFVSTKAKDSPQSSID